MTGFQTLTCRHGDTLLQGELARPAGTPAGTPGGAAILMFPGATGPGESFRAAMRELAAEGHLVVGVDMYGAGADISSREAAGGHFADLMAQPGLLRERVTTWFEHVRGLDGVDAGRIAALGYCFGGKCVLELARSGADVQVVSSFHGLLTTDAPARAGAVRARIAVWTGGDDPYVPAEDVQALRGELDMAGANYQLTLFARAKHAFTDPDHDGLAPGIAYDRVAHRIAWMGTRALLAETIGG